MLNLSQQYETEIAKLTAEVNTLREACFAPLSTVTPREFARTLRMPDAHGATKPFDLLNYQEEMYAELFNPRNQEVDFMLASRLGKSRVVMCALGFKLKHEPCRMAVMWPVEGDGKLWSKDDLMGEFIEPNPQLAELIDDTRGQRSSANTILTKRGPGFLLQIVGSNAPGRLRRIKGEWLYGEEIDACVGTQNDEGSILDIFAKRGAEFPGLVQIYCSYPSVRHRSAIEAKLLRTDLRQWFVHCAKCGDPFILHRTGVDPFNDKQLRSRLVYDPSEPQFARLKCPHCPAEHLEAGRVEMMKSGLWKATREFQGRAGFQAGSLLWPHDVSPEKYPGGFLQILAQKELAIENAENPEKARRVLVNTDDGETYESECDMKPEHSKLFLRREQWGTADKPWTPSDPLPAGVLWITLAWDIQADRAEGEIVGHGLKNQTWGLGYHVIKGTPMAPPDTGIWAEMARICDTTTFAHPSGKVMRISAEGVDRGYKPDHVLAYTRARRRRGTVATRGATSLSKPLIRAKAGWEGNPKAKVWELGTNEGKDITYQRLERDNIAADGFMHYPVLACYSEQHFKMLTAEDSDMQKASDGKFYRCFRCEEGVRNEALDIRVITLALRAIRKPKMEKLAVEFALPKEAADLAGSQEKGKPGAEKAANKTAVNYSENNSQPVQPQPKPKGAAFVRRIIGNNGGKGFVGGWKR